MFEAQCRHLTAADRFPKAVAFEKRTEPLDRLFRPARDPAHSRFPCRLRSQQKTLSACAIRLPAFPMLGWTTSHKTNEDQLSGCFSRPKLVCAGLVLQTARLIANIPAIACTVVIRNTNSEFAIRTVMSYCPPFAASCTMRKAVGVAVAVGLLTLELDWFGCNNLHVGLQECRRMPFLFLVEQPSIIPSCCSICAIQHHCATSEYQAPTLVRSCRTSAQNRVLRPISLGHGD